MRVVSALVLTHCFGCVIPDDSDDEFLSGRGFNPKLTSSKQISVDSRSHSVFNVDPASCVVKNCDSYEDSLQKNSQEEGLVYLLPERRASAETREKATQVTMKHDESKNRSKRSEDKHKSSSQSCEKSDRRECTGRKFQRRYQRRMRKLRYGKDCELLKNTESGTTKCLWDKWSDWSECSATCGIGHRVRWSYCISRKCADGLKKAQFKKCCLKKCQKYNIFYWLGITN